MLYSIWNPAKRFQQFYFYMKLYPADSNHGWTNFSVKAPYFISFHFEQLYLSVWVWWDLWPYSTGKIREMSVKFCVGTWQVLVTARHMVQLNKRNFFKLISNRAAQVVPHFYGCLLCSKIPYETEKILQFDWTMWPAVTRTYHVPTQNFTNISQILLVEYGLW